MENIQQIKKQCGHDTSQLQKMHASAGMLFIHTLPGVYS